MRSAVQLGLGRWATWQTGSVNRRVFAAMVTVGGFTVLAKLAAVAKEIAVAYQFGTSDELDAFLIAFLLPQFAVNVMWGSLNGALIPTYIHVREQEGREAAQRVLSSLMVLGVGSVMALSVVLALTASSILPLVASGFAVEKLGLTHSLYDVLLPTLVLSGVATIWGAILNAENRFALAAVAPMATSIVTVIIVGVMAKHWGIYTLALGTIVGALIETGLLGWGLTREGISLIPKWYGMSPAAKQVLDQYTPALTANFLMGSTGLVSQSMAATLGPGSVSVLAYGKKVTDLILGVFGLSVGTAVLPHFSKMVSGEDWRGVRRTLMTYTRLLLLITLPLMLALIYFSEPIVKLLFQRGAFTEANAQFVGLVQVMYLLQVPAYVLSILLARLISALKAIHLLTWGAVINLCSITVLTYVLMQWFQVVGIALATSAMFCLSCAYLLVVSFRLLSQQSGERG